MLLLQAQIRARLSGVCSEMSADEFEILIRQIARIETGWLQSPISWPERKGPGETGE